MIVNEKERWVYLGPPKTASTAMHDALQKEPWNGVQLDPGNQHDMLPPDEYIDFFVFGTIRSPYERAVSLFWHYLRDVRRIRGIMEGLSTRAEWTTKPLPESEFSFEDYMRGVIDLRLRVIEDPSAPFFTYTISDWLHDAMPLNAYIRQEHLVEDFSALPFVDGREVVFPKKNAPGRRPWKDYQNEKTIALVDEWATEDFKRFPYESQADTR